MFASWVVEELLDMQVCLHELQLMAAKAGVPTRTVDRAITAITVR